jgi:hypothetical protein
MDDDPTPVSGRSSPRLLLAGVAVVVVGVAVAAAVVVLGPDDGSERPEAEPRERACGASDPLVIDTVGTGDWTMGLARVKPHGKPEVVTGDWVAVSPAFSPDGKQVVFERVYGDYESAGPGPSELWIMDADGSDPRMLRSTGGAPAWSPDGSTIAFGGVVEPDDDVGGIIEVPIDGGDARAILLIDGGFQLQALAWSPDGDQLAYILEPPGPEGDFRGSQQRSLWIVNADGSDAHEVAQLNPEAAHLDWGPEGSAVLVSTWTHTYGEVSIVDPQTGESRAAAPLTGYARWAPGGATVIVRMRTSSADPEGYGWRLAEAKVVDGQLERIAFVGDAVGTWGTPQDGIAVSPVCPAA